MLSYNKYKSKLILPNRNDYCFYLLLNDNGETIASSKHLATFFELLNSIKKPKVNLILNDTNINDVAISLGYTIVYKIDNEQFKNDVNKFSQEALLLYNQFKEDLFKEYNVLYHSKRRLCFDISCGLCKDKNNYAELEEVFGKLVKLI